MVDFEKLKAPGTPPPPPPPKKNFSLSSKSAEAALQPPPPPPIKKKRAALQPPPHPKRQEVVPSAESQTFPEGLTEKERALFESVAEYAQITEGEAVLRPELLAALRSFRKKELFAVQVYGLDGKGSDGHTGFPTFNSDALKGDGGQGIWLGGRELGFKERYKIPEALSYEPLARPESVIQERVVKPTGLFKSLKKPAVEKVITGRTLRPVRFKDVVPDCRPEHAAERAVRIRYHVSDHEVPSMRYPTTTGARMPWLRHVPKQTTFPGRNTIWSPAVYDAENPVNDLKLRTHDLARMRQIPIKELDPSGGRPDNQVVIAVYLPESLAKELFHILQENPKQVRPFFLAGALDRMPHHLPPPYEMFDKENGNKRQVIFRDFTQPKEPKETVL